MSETKPETKAKAAGAYRVLLGTIVAGVVAVSADDEAPFIDIPKDEAERLIAEGVIERV